MINEKTKQMMAQFFKELKSFHIPETVVPDTGSTFEHELKSYSAKTYDETLRKASTPDNQIGPNESDLRREKMEETRKASIPDEELKTVKPEQLNKGEKSGTGNASGAAPIQKMEITGVLQLRADGSALIDAEGGVPLNE